MSMTSRQRKTRFINNLRTPEAVANIVGALCLLYLALFVLGAF